MSKRVFTPEQEDQIVAQYRAGVGAQVIGRSMGCSAKPVERIVLMHGAYEANRRFRGRYTAEQKEEMCRRYNAGESLHAVGVAFGCTTGNVKQILQRRGIDRRPWGSAPVSPALVERIYQLRQEGHSQQFIAAEVGRSQSAVGVILRRGGFPSLPVRSGNAHPSWKGGRYTTPAGYVYVQADPDDEMFIMANVLGYIMEHRLVIARSIGRPLTRKETVHHINGDTADNRLANLQLRAGQHGQGVVMACLDCGSHNVGPVPIK